VTITFADGTRIEIAASALDDFIKHDLKWVEFVHGRADNQLVSGSLPYLAGLPKQNVHRCPSHAC
jgi:hypothetical protein